MEEILAEEMVEDVTLPYNAGDAEPVAQAGIVDEEEYATGHRTTASCPWMMSLVGGDEDAGNGHRDGEEDGGAYEVRGVNSLFSGAPAPLPMLYVLLVAGLYPLKRCCRCFIP